MTPFGRVVLDTNVLVGAAFNPGSASAEVVRAVRNGRLRMPWTEATREEAERILRTIPPLSWSGMRDLFRDEDRVEEALDETGLGWIPDPADRKFAALARAARAALVSSDTDLLGGRARAAFTIVTPEECRDRGLP